MTRMTDAALGAIAAAVPDELESPARRALRGCFSARARWRASS